MLTEAPAGYEKKMAYVMKEYFEEYSDEVFLDRFGNTIAKFEGTEINSNKVMVFAHMDQLGLIIRKIDNDGFIQVDRLGGIPEKILPALNVSVSNESGEYIDGVIGVKSHHMTPADEKYKVDPVTSLYIDIGAKSRKEVEDLGINIGCPIIYKPAFNKLVGNSVSGTAVDNRAGCTSLIQIACNLKKHKPKSTTYIVGTVNEEFTIRGAVIAARNIKPDIAICIDVSISGDPPDLKNTFDLKIGAGPSIMLYTFHGRGTLNGTIPQKNLVELALATSKEDNIPIQRFSALGMILDSAYVQTEGEGVAIVPLGIPAKYTHSPVESCDIKDIEKLSQLITGMLMRIDNNFDLNRF